MTEERLAEIEAHATQSLAGGDSKEETIEIRLAYGRYGPNEALDLVAEVHRLRAALVDFGQHGFDLNCRCCPKALSGDRNGNACTCGLDAALNGDC